MPCHAMGARHKRVGNEKKKKTHDQILVVLIRCLLFLLKRAHKPLSGDDAFLDLGQVHLDE